MNEVLPVTSILPHAPTSFERHCSVLSGAEAPISSN
jgi:hypothetical protein